MCRVWWHREGTLKLGDTGRDEECPQGPQQGVCPGQKLPGQRGERLPGLSGGDTKLYFASVVGNLV